MKLDFSGVQSFTSDPVPAGTYPTTLFSCKPKKAQSTGNSMLEWVFEISEGDYQRRRVFINTVLSQEARWKLKAILRGFAPSLDLDLEGEIDFEPSDLIGMGVLAVVTQRIDNKGVLRNEVSNTLPLQDEDDEDDNYFSSDEDEDQDVAE